MNRNVLAGVFAAVGGAATAWGIMTVVSGVGIGTCTGSFEACGLDPTAMGAMVGGPILFIVGGFLGHFTAWMVGPLAGLLTAGAMAAGREGGLSSGDLGFGAFIAACVLLGPVLLLAMRGRSHAKLRKAEHLMQTGSRGVARVQAATFTGVTVNEQPQLKVSYTIHPLERGQPFAHTKRQMLDFGGIRPQPGLAWPCWFDPADQKAVAIGAPASADPEYLALLADFGIPPQQAFGYDPTGGITLPDPQASAGPMP